MTEDFSIKDAVCLVSAGHCLDLHNHYAFSDLAYAISERRVTLTWRRRSDDWVPATEPAQVRLVFHGVSRFLCQPRNPGMPFTEDACLSSAGYWTDEDWCEGVMVCETAPENNWLRAFAFQSGASVMIAADEARALIAW